MTRTVPIHDGIEREGVVQPIRMLDQLAAEADDSLLHCHSCEPASLSVFTCCMRGCVRHTFTGHAVLLLQKLEDFQAAQLFLDIGNRTDLSFYVKKEPPAGHIAPGNVLPTAILYYCYLLVSFVQYINNANS